jgi:catechol 2,3-dioxygenase-like lactoylglutathione lyase family enzyme
MRVPRLLGTLLGALLLVAGPGYSDSGTDAAAVIQLRYVTVVVKSYDEALAWYTNVLGLKKIEDRNLGPGHRWLVVAPEGQAGLGIVLDLAASSSMDAPSSSKDDRIGKETNWVLRVQDCRVFYDLLSKRGVHFIQPPADEPWGTTQAVFEDLYGNVFVAESQGPRGSVSNGRALGSSHP